MSDWNPLDPAVLADVSAAHDAMRERCPVAHSDDPRLQVWSIFRYDDVLATLRNTDSFSNARPDTPFPNIPISLDPPEHATTRDLLVDYFKPQKLREFETQIRDVAKSLVTPFVAAGGGNVREEYSEPFTLRSLAVFFGWEVGDWQQLRAWHGIHARATAAGNKDSVESNEHQKLLDYIRQVMRARRNSPRNDLTSWLTKQSSDVVTDDVIINLLLSVLLLGYPSTSAVASFAVVYLATHAGIQTTLRSSPELIPTAVEEFVRLGSPVVSMPRIATRDIVVRGRRIRAGELVGVMLGAANRDPEAFPDPGSLIPERYPNQHVGFGHGIHYCVGASLARLMLQITTEEFISATSHWRVTDQIGSHDRFAIDVTAR